MGRGRSDNGSPYPTVNITLPRSNEWGRQSFKILIMYHCDVESTWKDLIKKKDRQLFDLLFPMMNGQIERNYYIIRDPQPQGNKQKWCLATGKVRDFLDSYAYVKPLYKAKIVVESVLASRNALNSRARALGSGQTPALLAPVVTVLELEPSQRLANSLEARIGKRQAPPPPVISAGPSHREAESNNGLNTQKQGKSQSKGGKEKRPSDNSEDQPVSKSVRFQKGSADPLAGGPGQPLTLQLSQPNSVRVGAEAEANVIAVRQASIGVNQQGREANVTAVNQASIGLNQQGREANVTAVNQASNGVKQQGRGAWGTVNRNHNRDDAVSVASVMSIDSQSDLVEAGIDIKDVKNHAIKALKKEVDNNTLLRVVKELKKFKKDGKWLRMASRVPVTTHLIQTLLPDIFGP